MLMQIKELDTLYPFKFRASQRRWRIFNGKFTLPNSEDILEEDRGKLLITYDGCSQMVMSPDDTVIVDENHITNIKEFTEAPSEGTPDMLPF